MSGKAVAEQIRAELKILTDELVKTRNIRPTLALMLVGENSSSIMYVNSKHKACDEIGFRSITLNLPEDTSEESIINQIIEWNADESVHGILVQLPLPRHIDEQKVIKTISPDKDVDGFHPESIGRLVIGLPGFVSCTPLGIMELLKYYNIETSGKHVVVAGRSNIVGKPIANLLYQKNPSANAIVTICHTAAKDLSYYLRQADILIAAMGVPHRIKADDVKEGVVVVDVGINRIEDLTKPKGYRVVGDVDYESVEPKASAITPVPGGVGLMTVAMLMKNTFHAAKGLGF